MGFNIITQYYPIFFSVFLNDNQVFKTSRLEAEYI